MQYLFKKIFTFLFRALRRRGYCVRLSSRLAPFRSSLHVAALKIFLEFLDFLSVCNLKGASRPPGFVEIAVKLQRIEHFSVSLTAAKIGVALSL